MKKLMVLGSWLMVFSLPLFAQETLTITTYYPAPFGVYQRLVTQTLGVGDTNASGGIDASDAPNPTVAAQEGDVWIAGDVGIGTNNPQAKLDVVDEVKIGMSSPTPLPCNNDTAGAMRYNVGKMEYCDGTATPPTWKAIGGGLEVTGAKDIVTQPGYCGADIPLTRLIRTITVATSGGKVLVIGSYTGHGGADNWCANARLTRDDTDIYKTLNHHPTAHGFTGLNWDSPVIFTIDQPAAGTHTYALYGPPSAVGATINIYGSELYAIELE
jgi:hypothetical protein